MKALGIQGSPPPAYKRPDFFEVWPENVDAVRVFIMSSTQWRMGFNGPVGLDYNAVFQMFTLYEIEKKKEVFEGLKIMENTVLSEMASRK
jgi:hypothetical protein